MQVFNELAYSKFLEGLVERVREKYGIDEEVGALKDKIAGLIRFAGKCRLFMEADVERFVNYHFAYPRFRQIIETTYLMEMLKSEDFSPEKKFSAIESRLVFENNHG